jgi:tetratricopeptide (TPR) repeat protein
VWYVKLGNVQMALGHLPDALQAYQAALAIADRLAKSDPGNAGWRHYLSVSYDKVGDVHLKMNDYDRALQDYGHAIKLDPDDSDTLVTRGCIYLKLKKPDLALADYDAALKVKPKAASSLYLRSVVKQLKGDKAGAAADADAAKQIEPDIAQKFQESGKCPP